MQHDMDVAAGVQAKLGARCFLLSQTVSERSPLTTTTIATTTTNTTTTTTTATTTTTLLLLRISVHYCHYYYR